MATPSTLSSSGLMKDQSSSQRNNPSTTSSLKGSGVELDAVQALLGASPTTASSTCSSDASSTFDNTMTTVPPHNRHLPAGVVRESLRIGTTATSYSQLDAQWNQETATAMTSKDTATLFIPPEQQQQSTNSLEEEPANLPRRPRSGSVGLDALADVASLEQQQHQQATTTTTTTTTSTIKNGDTVTTNKSSFVVVSTGVSSSDSDHDDENEEEDDDDEEETDDDNRSTTIMPPPPPRRQRPRAASNPEGMERWHPNGSRQNFVLPASILEEELAQVSAAMKEQQQQRRLRQQQQQQRTIPEDETVEDSENPASLEEKDEEEEEEVDESTLTPDELLQRARARLLEDLLEGKMHSDKGVMTLPHSLEKYKDIYNKNGRVGIYSPSERAAIIAKFQRKRSRRVWNKKIRYNCRKSLADRRLRVKGRFVKRSEQEQLAKELAAQQAQDGDAGQGNEDTLLDEDMPDVNDPEAGFAPTEDQPYRRLRRHTVT